MKTVTCIIRIAVALLAVTAFVAALFAYKNHDDVDTEVEA